MFDRARHLDLIEGALDTDPYCPVCGAPTDHHRRGGTSVLVCSGRRSRRPSSARIAAALVAAHATRDHRPGGGPRRLTAPRGARRPARSVPSQRWPSSCRRSIPRSSRRRPRSTSAAAAARHAGSPRRSTAPTSSTTREDAPELSDAEYDQLFRELVALETAHPGADHGGLADPARRWRADRATLRRGPPPPADAQSLANAFSHDELRAFDARVRKRPRLPAAPEPATGCATSPSSRSTAWPSPCATSAGASSRARRAATARPART